MKKNLLIPIVLFFGLIHCAELPTATASNRAKESLTTPVHTCITPQTVDELQDAIRTATGKVSVKGACYSQGNHCYITDGVSIDMSRLNKIVSLDTTAKTIAVQTGALWKDVQEHIDPFDLSVTVMQSYNNFSIGGSLAVNCHGRYLGYGPLIQTVLSIMIVLADGSLIEASRTINSDLFYGAIGGYGALGIIVEATLQLSDNILMERKAVCLPIVDYPDFFKTIKANPQAIMHNADLYPPHFDTVTSITWQTTTKQPTITERLKQHKPIQITSLIKMGIAKRLAFFHKIRPSVELFGLTTQTVIWKNYEASYHTDELFYPQIFSTSLLQEYFIPIDHIVEFLDSFKTIVTEHGMNILNVSLRHVAPNNESILSWSEKESFAVVIFYDQWKTEAAFNNADICTKKLINAALAVGGTYYLPYRLHASTSQLNLAYPRNQLFWQIKEKYDPTHIFSNTFLETYFC